jgi:hypothetical protein
VKRDPRSNEIVRSDWWAVKQRFDINGRQGAPHAKGDVNRVARRESAAIDDFDRRGNDNGLYSGVEKRGFPIVRSFDPGQK